MSLVLNEKIKKMIISSVEKVYPEEACGLLIGKMPDNFDQIGRKVIAQDVRSLPNGWDSSAKNNRYLIDPMTLAKIEKDLSAYQQCVIGFYHSHPDVPAWPSPFDLMMAWPCQSYLIVRVNKARAQEFRSWQRTEDGQSFIEEDVVVEA